jgi:hypothetical protein
MADLALSGNALMLIIRKQHLTAAANSENNDHYTRDR